MKLGPLPGCEALSSLLALPVFQPLPSPSAVSSCPEDWPVEHLSCLLADQRDTVALEFTNSFPGGGLQAVDQHVRLFLQILQSRSLQHSGLEGVIAAVETAI